MLNIFTLSWNGLDKLTKLKESILPCLKNIESWTWFIKDNGSQDQTVEVASKWDDRIKVIPYKNNIQNFSEGMNFLFDFSKPKSNDLILLLNNDVVFGDTTSITKMIELINKKEVGLVGARLLFTNTNKLQHAGVVFNPRIGMPLHFRANEETDSNAEKNRLFQAVTGAVALTTADIYGNICKNADGSVGLDNNLRWAFDDIDMCLSIHVNMKKKIVYCGNTKIFHEESATLKKNPANKLFMSHNIMYFKNKWNNKYVIDQDLYTRDAKYNIYK